jgi:hypothetical protein
MIEASDVVMRICAIIGGFIGIVEAIFIFIGQRLMPYGFDWISGLIGILLAISALSLGIKPIDYAPFLLGVIGVVLIILGLLIGGIAVLIATFFGLLS